jgi:nucleotide-binding universal stress UspA family protein
MLSHLLVPLDGSRLAEAALPAAAALAQRLRARVTLLHVVERDPPREVHGEPHLHTAAEAGAYLDDVALRAFAAVGPVACHVHEGAPDQVVASIVTQAGELTPDLIVMCTHGRGGLQRVLFGSIAQQVIQRGRTPVLLVRPTGDGGAPPFALRRVIVPLDGNPEHAVALPLAAALARAFGAALHLTAVVPTRATLAGQQAAAGQLMPAATAQLLEVQAEEVEAYLVEAAERLRAEGLAVEREVVRGDPATVIHETVVRTGADLVVLASHGRVGIEAFLAGSVASAVVKQATTPLLVVPIAP